MSVTGYRNGKKANMILTLVLWCILCSICMAVMLMASLDKVIVIADAEQTELGENNTQEIFPSAELKLTEDNSMESQLCIPLEEGIKAEKIVMENRYIDRELWIYIQQAQYSFYDENAIIGDISPIKEGWYEAQEDRIVLKLAMADVMEYQSTLENGSLKLAFFKPEELYEQIVVIDPVGGGSDNGITVEGCLEKELTCQVAKLVQKNMSNPEVKVYFTRTEDVDVSAEKRRQLVEDVNADLYLRLSVSENTENTDTYGIQTYYNEEYYIPEFGSVQWADIVTRKVTIAASNRAIGLLPAGEGSILRLLEIPAVQINLGFMTNPQECFLLQQESYQEKLAQGIVEAILDVYLNKEGKQQVK